VEQVLEFHRQGYTHVLDADVSGFFDNLSHAAIMKELSKVVADGNILRLVQKFLSAGVMEGGKYQATRMGTPQGGVVSPLLANIALNLMDWQLEKAGFRFVRYADDFVVLCKSNRKAKEAMDMVSKLLADQLGLALSPDKTKITTFKNGFAFLGFQIGAWSVRMREKSLEKFKDKVREITTRSHNLDAEMIRKLNRVIRGTANYFAKPWSTCRYMYRTLDRWIRMRLRCMKTKRKSMEDNRRIRLKHIEHMGLLSLTSFIPERIARSRGSP
jgi:group II intron reverse transcriptase/maturase